MTMLENNHQEPSKPTYGYYRQPDGWITASPCTDTDELQYRRSGWEPLRQYGSFEMSTPYMANHPLEPLFMRGGAAELGEEQIRQMGLYIDPPKVPTCRTPLGQDHKHHTGACLARAKPVVFPQLESMTDRGPFPCTICSRPFPTTEARDQHTMVMHAPEKSDERTGQSLSAALIKGLGGRNSEEPAAATEVTALLEQMQEMKRELAALKGSNAEPSPKPEPVATAPSGPYTVKCEKCGKVFTSAVKAAFSKQALTLHMKAKHTAAQELVTV